VKALTQLNISAVSKENQKKAMKQWHQWLSGGCENVGGVWPESK
jgi:hypothetical protein